MGTEAVGMAMAMQQQALQQAVSTSVMKMGMDTVKQSAGAITEMMQEQTAVARAAQPHLGSLLDIKA